MTACSDGSRAEGLSVYIADDGLETCEFLRDAIETGTGWSVAGISRCYEDFITDKPEADVWLIGSAYLGLTPPEKLRGAAIANPRTIVLAITDTGDYAELKAALRRGARDVVVCDGPKEEIRGLIEDHYYENKRRLELLERQIVFGAEDKPARAENESETSRGHVAVITGADGGTGKTFVAAQLAGLAAKHGGAKTVLVDLDMECGALGSILGLSGVAKRALADLAGVADELTAEHVESVVFTHPYGFSFAPAVLSRQSSCAGEIPVARVIDFLKDLFDVVICDTPAAILDTGLTQVVDCLYIVAAPDRVSAECAARLGRKFPQGKLIINMCDRKGAAAAEKMAEATRLEVAAAIPEDVGAGRLFDAEGVILADRTELAIVRSLVPVAQRCRDFAGFSAGRRPSIWRRGAGWKNRTPRV
jgi:Mrp family chromosome partitioning ATPase